MRPVLNLGEILSAHARLQPHKIGARDSRRALTYAQWNERACRLANALLRLGLAPGDRVAVLAYNCIEWMEIYIALAKAGLVAVPVNFRLLAPEIQYIAEHSSARALIVQDALAAQVEALRGMLPIAPEAWIRIGGTTPSGWTGYEALVEHAPDDEPNVKLSPTDTYVFVVTEGGYAKRTRVEDYRKQQRAGLGIKVAKLSEDRGDLAGALIASGGDEVLVVLASGKVVRSDVAEVPAKGRDTMGVVFAKFADDDRIIAIARNSERNLVEEAAESEAAEPAGEE